MRKQLILVALALLILAACETASKKKEVVKVTADTQIKFNELHHKFGTLTEGETVGCFFKFTNIGSDPLLLSKVTPGCGCTSAQYTQTPVMPGDSGEIEIRFDTRGFSGKQYKVIKVEANIPKKIVELVISAQVTN